MPAQTFTVIASCGGNLYNKNNYMEIVTGSGFYSRRIVCKNKFLPTLKNLTKISSTIMFRVAPVHYWSCFGKGPTSAHLSGLLNLPLPSLYFLIHLTIRFVGRPDHRALPIKPNQAPRCISHKSCLYKGISGFQNAAKAKYDTFGVGHSSTSISAALGGCSQPL